MTYEQMKAKEKEALTQSAIRMAVDNLAPVFADKKDLLVELKAILVSPNDKQFEVWGDEHPLEYHALINGMSRIDFIFDQEDMGAFAVTEALSVLTEM